jgi:hypothetical protein
LNFTFYFTFVFNKIEFIKMLLFLFNKSKLQEKKLEECLNRGEKVCGIFFDISKAFDKVWHAGLIFQTYLSESTHVHH